jgi:hypothetical protein
MNRLHQFDGQVIHQHRIGIIGEEEHHFVVREFPPCLSILQYPAGFRVRHDFINFSFFAHVLLPLPVN